ncbi:hypothetical protein [Magnetofaba australis]|nr:hypothetical protein [Magnetofaba australis]
MVTTLKTTLATNEALKVAGPGEIKVMAAKGVSITKISPLSLPGMTASVKSTALGLNVLGPALGLAGVVLATAWFLKMAVKAAESAPKSE